MRATDIQAIGEFIRERRKACRLTQGDVAEHLGVSPQAVSKWERGENLPDMAFFPDISRLLKVGAQEILNAGMAAGMTPSGLDADIDGFVYLAAPQKQHFIEQVLLTADYGLALDEILPYCNTPQRAAIVQHILKQRDYDLLEFICPHMNNEMKQTALEELLRRGCFEIIEDIMPAFTRKHRDIIVEFFSDNTTDEDIIENFIPFFDKNQRERLKKALIKEEKA